MEPRSPGQTARKKNHPRGEYSTRNEQHPGVGNLLQGKLRVPTGKVRVTETVKRGAHSEGESNKKESTSAASDQGKFDGASAT